jgi:preprotein translocase subunit SecY
MESPAAQPRLLLDAFLASARSYAARLLSTLIVSLRSQSPVLFIVLAYWAFNQFPFGGTSVLITVGVALETMKQIESQLMMRHYEGFLK